MLDVMTSALMVVGAATVAYTSFLALRLSLDFLYRSIETARVSARLARTHPDAAAMSRAQMLHTFAILATQRPGPQRSDDWAACEAR